VNLAVKATANHDKEQDANEPIEAIRNE
jgi:hypothetical protein